MSKINDGGSAFPVLMKVGDVAKSEAGMSLRDWFAGQALPAVIAATSAGQHDVLSPKPGKPVNATVVAALAFDAYELADAMLAAREGGAK